MRRSKPSAHTESPHLEPSRRLLDSGKDSFGRSHGDPKSVLNQVCLGEQMLAVVGGEELRLGMDRTGNDRCVFERDVSRRPVSPAPRADRPARTCPNARKRSKYDRARGALLARLRRVSSIYVAAKNKGEISTRTRHDQVTGKAGFRAGRGKEDARVDEDPSRTRWSRYHRARAEAPRARPGQPR